MDRTESSRTVGRGPVARRRFLRTAAATAVALPAVAAATAGRVAAGGPPPNPQLMYKAALTPYRCYDSRWATTTGGGSSPTLGRLNLGTTRDVAVWNRFDNAGDYLDSPIPASTEILAVTFNLTVVSTINSGNLAVGPGGSTPTSSHINWFASNQVLANAGTVRIFPGEFGDVQTIAVRAGGAAGSSTHFVVDITGWFEEASTGPILL